MTAIKTGLIGLGYSGQTFHLPFVNGLDAFDLCAVQSSRADAAASLAPGAKHCRSLDELLACDIELVIITAPNAQHFPLAAAALRAGKHVVVEKPFVTSSSDGEALIALAGQQQRVLSVYQNRRWDGDFLTVQGLISEGALGKVFTYESHFDRFRPEIRDRWREQAVDGSGILFDLGPHLVDQALMLFGMPVAVTAQVLAQRVGAKTDDYFHLVLDYDDLQVILHADMTSVRPGPRFRINCERGSFVSYGLDPQEDRLRAIAKASGTAPGKATPAMAGILTDSNGTERRVDITPGSYASYFEQLAFCLRNGGSNPVPAGQALTGLRMIESARRSAIEGRRITL